MAALGTDEDLVQRLRKELHNEATSRQRQEEISQKLQVEYDVLLKRLAEAELHIDRLRFGGNEEADEHFVASHSSQEREGTSTRPRGAGYSPHSVKKTRPPIKASGSLPSPGGASLTTDSDLKKSQDSTSRSVSQSDNARQCNTSDIQATLSLLSSDDATLFSPGKEEDGTEDFSQLSTTTIADRASAESVQMLHFFHIHDLEEKISSVEAKLCSGCSVSVDEVKIALTEIQSDHQQLVQDVTKSQEELQALRLSANGKASNHIIRSQEALESELSQLAERLSQLHVLLSSKGPSLQQQPLPAASSGTESALCSPETLRPVSTESSPSGLSCDSLNTPPALPEKYYSQSHPEDHMMSRDNSVDSRMDHMMSYDSLNRQPSQDSLEPHENVTQPPLHHPHTPTIDSHTTQHNPPASHTQAPPMQHAHKEPDPHSEMTLLGDGDSGFAGSCIPRPSTTASCYTTGYDKSEAGATSETTQEEASSEDRLPTLTIAAIEALRNELAELKVEVMKSSQKRDSSMFHSTDSSGLLSYTPILHSTPVKTTPLVTPVGTPVHSSFATPRSHDQDGKSHDQGAKSHDSPKGKLHPGVQVVQHVTPVSVTTSSEPKAKPHKQARFKTFNSRQLTPQDTATAVPESSQFIRQSAADTSLTASAIGEAGPHYSFSVRRHSVPVAPPSYLGPSSRGGEGSSVLTTHRAPSTRDYQSSGTMTATVQHYSSPLAHSCSSRTLHHPTPGSHHQGKASTPSARRYDDRVSDCTPNAAPRQAFMEEDGTTPRRRHIHHHSQAPHTISSSKPSSSQHSMRRRRSDVVGGTSIKPRSLHREIRGIQQTPSGQSRSNVIRIVTSSSPAIPRRMSDEALGEDDYHSEPLVMVATPEGDHRRHHHRRRSRRRKRSGEFSGSGGRGQGRVSTVLLRPNSVDEVYLVRKETLDQSRRRRRKGDDGDSASSSESEGGEGEVVLGHTTAMELEQACRMARQLEKRAQRLKTSLHSEIARYEHTRSSHFY